MDPTQFEVCDDRPAQNAKRLGLFRFEAARAAVDDAERAERVAVGSLERNARVKPDRRVVPHERVICEPLVRERVFNDEQVRLEDRVCAERLVFWVFPRCGARDAT